MATNVSSPSITFPMPTHHDFGIDCFSPLMVMTNGIWLGDNPFRYSLSLLLIQLLLITAVARAFYFLLTPLHQPMIVAEMLAGFVLGPSGLGRWYKKYVILFPSRSIHILSSVADLGLVLFAFIVGVEMDLKVLKRMGKRATVIGAVTTAVPLVVSTATTYKFRHLFPESATNDSFYIYLSVALSITVFPVLARVLREFNLVNSELGHVSVSASIISEMLAWVLLASMVGFTRDVMPMQYIAPAIAALVLVCIFAVRPALVWFMSMTPEGEQISDVHAGIILLGVPLAVLFSEFVGIEFYFGAFIYGLVVPSELHGTELVEKMEDLVTGFLMPIIIAAGGLNINLGAFQNPAHVAAAIFIFVLSCLTKVLVTTLSSLFYKMPLHESVSLGFLMNTRGDFAPIMIHLSKDKFIGTKETYTLLVVASMVMTALSVPVVATNYKPSRAQVQGEQRRNLVLARTSGQQLRVLACIHTARSVPSTIALLDLSNPTKRSPISIYALHLVELTGRASAMIINHNSSTTTTANGGKQRNSHRRRRHHHPLSRHYQAQSDQIVSSFEAYEQHAGGVSLQALTSISSYSAMHEDICHVANDKQADIILLPFHKLQTVDGNMEAEQPAIRAVNRNILKHAPCSVAILVDRYLGKTIGHGIPHRIALLFFGGPDDREALACAWRMADHPNVSLTIVRFVSSEEEAEEEEGAEDERAMDDEYINEFRLRHLSCESIVYEENVVKNSEEMVERVRLMGTSVHDLYIVGRSQGRGASKLTSGITEWSECPELGPVGDLLASGDFGTKTSVLVVQQYVVSGKDELTESQSVMDYVSKANHRDVANRRKQQTCVEMYK